MKKFILLCFLLGFSFYLFNYFAPCHNTIVNFWIGETKQNNYSFKMFNFKIVGMSNSCLNQLGNNFEIKLNNDFLAKVEINDDNNYYTLFYKNQQLRKKRHLEIFSGIKNNFTIGLSEEDIKDKPLHPFLSNKIDIYNNKFSFQTKLNTPLSYENKIILPKIDYHIKDNTVFACSEINNELTESIRIDFETQNQNRTDHIQEVCTNSAFYINKKSNLCCSSKIPEDTKKIGLIRWSGDSHYFTFKEEFNTIKE